MFHHAHQPGEQRGAEPGAHSADPGPPQGGSSSGTSLQGLVLLGEKIPEPNPKSCRFVGVSWFSSFMVSGVLAAWGSRDGHTWGGKGRHALVPVAQLHGGWEDLLSPPG